MESAGSMPKRNTRSVETIFVPPPPVPEEVALVCQIDAKVKVEGMYSGREYIFDGAGSVVNVDQRDVEWLLSKRQGGRQCCGGTGGGNVVFKLAEE